MSYLTFEVEIDHGKVVLKDAAQLPPKASGLLTVFQPDAQPRPALTPLQAWTRCGSICSSMPSKQPRG